MPPLKPHPAPQLLSRRNVLLSTLVLAGCSAAPVVFDASNLPRIRRMAVLTPGFPTKPSVATQPPTNGAVFLLVGSIQASNRSDEFAGFMTHEGANPEGQFNRKLLEGLQTAGLQPTLVPADARRTDFAKDYAALKTGAYDSMLDVVVKTYGYYAIVNSAPFKPTVDMTARLIDLQSGTVLMQDRMDMINIEPTDPKVTLASFQNYSDIAASPAQAVMAVMSGLDMAADTVCKRLA